MINANSHRIRRKYRRDAEAVAEAAEKGGQTTSSDIIIMGRQDAGMRFDLLCIISAAIGQSPASPRLQRNISSRIIYKYLQVVQNSASDFKCLYIFRLWA